MFFFVVFMSAVLCSFHYIARHGFVRQFVVSVSGSTQWELTEHTRRLTGSASVFHPHLGLFLVDVEGLKAQRKKNGSIPHEAVTASG